MHTLFVVPVAVISIHALRGEGDRLRRGLIMRAEEFQSTPSVGRATKVFRLRRHDSDISIHALRGEGDVSAVQSVFTDVTFQSTPSVGRATIDKLTFFADYSISIHALRGEGDHRQTHILCRL